MSASYAVWTSSPPFSGSVGSAHRRTSQAFIAATCHLRHRQVLVSMAASRALAHAHKSNWISIHPSTVNVQTRAYLQSLRHYDKSNLTIWFPSSSSAAAAAAAPSLHHHNTVKTSLCGSWIAISRISFVCVRWSDEIHSLERRDTERETS